MSPEDKVKGELINHLAKTIVAGSVASQDSAFRLLIGLATFFVPAYSGLVAALGETVDETNRALFAAPIVFWLASLGISACFALPGIAWFDLKNPVGILDVYAANARRSVLWGRVAGVLLAIGSALAALFLAWGSAPPHDIFGP